MVADALPPLLVAHGVVLAHLARIAGGLESVAGDGAGSVCAVAGSHENGVGGVPVVVYRDVGSRIV